MHLHIALLHELLRLMWQVLLLQSLLLLPSLLLLKSLLLLQSLLLRSLLLLQSLLLLRSSLLLQSSGAAGAWAAGSLPGAQSRQSAHLEAFTIFLEAFRVFATASAHMVLATVLAFLQHRIHLLRRTRPDTRGRAGHRSQVTSQNTMSVALPPCLSSSPAAPPAPTLIHMHAQRHLSSTKEDTPAGSRGEFYRRRQAGPRS